MACDTSERDKIMSALTENVSLLHLSPGKQVPEWLSSVECPFSWQPNRFEDVSTTEVVYLAEEKAEFDDLPLDRFIRMLTLVYEFCHRKEFEEAEAKLKNSESLLKDERGFGFRYATSHVLHATQAYVLAMQDSWDKSRQECKELMAYAEMSATDQAAIQALKAKFFSSYQKKGFQQAVECSRKALELNPDEPMWMFLLAESLRRETKYFPRDEIPWDELNLLEKAVEKDRNPIFLVHMAFRYNCCASNIFHLHKDSLGFYNSSLCKSIEEMWNAATDLCKEALELAPDNEVINRRCGYTLMKSGFKNQIELKDFIRSVFEKALELYPDSTMTLHYLGKYYERLDRNNEKALEYYKKASEQDKNFPAQFDLIRLKFKMFGVKKYDPSEDFEWMLKKHCERDHYLKLSALSHMGSYQLFVKRDLQKALTYFKNILDEEESQGFMEKHLIIFLEGYRKINLYEYLTNQINLSDEKNLSDKYELLRRIATFSPEHVDTPGNEHLLDEISSKLRKLDMSKIKKPSNKSFPKDRNRGQSGLDASNTASSWKSSKHNDNRQNHKDSQQLNWRQRNKYNNTGQRIISSENTNWRQRKPNEEEC